METTPSKPSQQLKIQNEMETIQVLNKPDRAEVENMDLRKSLEKVESIQDLKDQIHEI